MQSQGYGRIQCRLWREWNLIYARHSPNVLAYSASYASIIDSTEKRLSTRARFAARIGVDVPVVQQADDDASKRITFADRGKQAVVIDNLRQRTRVIGGDGQLHGHRKRHDLAKTLPVHWRNNTLMRLYSVGSVT